MTHFPRRCAGLLAFALILTLASQAQEETPAPETPAPLLGHDIFRVPELADALRRVQRLLLRGDLEAGMGALDRLAAAFPDAGVLHAAKARIAGLIHPESAIEIDVIARQALAAVGAPVQTACPGTAPAGHAAGVVAEQRATKPAPVRPNKAPVTSGNTAWDPGTQRLSSYFTFPPILLRNPISLRSGEPARGGLPDPVLRQLQEWFLRGSAAGLGGVVYDNRDRDHSRLPELWPQLAFTDYSEAARAANVDYALNTQILFDAVAFGNSSTAFTAGELWRSLPRLGLTSPEGAARLFQLYASDHIYVFPEHRDHDSAAAGGHGDIFPANTPYYLVSQGSSGSDRALLVAVAAILAAMKKDVRAALDENNLVAPTVQMVFRAGLASVDGREEYMSPRSHPTAFRAEDIDLMRMIRIANALEADAVPPMPCLRVVHQTHPRPRSDYFADGLTEVLFDTPSAIARVWRGSSAERSLTVSAAQTRDPNGRKLRFHWRLLRGDPERVRITPATESGSEVELIVGWHERGEVPGQPGLTTDRVDIAVFADNGANLSAPGFISMVFPADQHRSYETLPDDTQRITKIDYASPERLKRYADPILFPKRNWRDHYAYDAEGRLIGWTRERDGMPDEAFTRHGLRTLSRDPLGRPNRAEEIGYPVSPTKRGTFEVASVATGRVYVYSYAHDADRLGRPVPETMPAR